MSLNIQYIFYSTYGIFYKKKNYMIRVTAQDTSSEYFVENTVL